jgi:hypothetical protein
MIAKPFAPENGAKPFAIMEDRFAPRPPPHTLANAEDRWMPSLAMAEGSGPVPDIPRR